MSPYYVSTEYCYSYHIHHGHWISAYLEIVPDIAFSACLAATRALDEGRPADIPSSLRLQAVQTLLVVDNKYRIRCQHVREYYVDNEVFHILGAVQERENGGGGWEGAKVHCMMNKS